MTTPKQAREVARRLDIMEMTNHANAVRCLADQVEALTAELESWRFTNRIDELQRAHDSYKKDAERYAKKYQHYHLGINGRICAVCDFDVTDPIHIREAAKGTAND